MGVNRYQAIKRCIRPDNDVFDELVDEWVLNSQEHWTPGLEVSIDESIYAYEVRKATQDKYLKEKDPVPIHYIPRKPHKNGLLAWVMATKSFSPTNLM
jgi:hypothetical protein